MTTGHCGVRRGTITRSVRIFSRAWYRFPYDLPDRDRLALAVSVLLAFVLVHVIVLVDAVVLVSARVLVLRSSRALLSS